MTAADIVPPDATRPFQLDRTGLRGRFVRLGTTLDEILGRHAYPDHIARPLGELVLLASALAGELKFDGSFSLQVRGSGPISLMVADCTNDGVVRGYASFDADIVPASSRPRDLYGDAVLALTLDQSAVGGELQQGIVQLEGASLTESMLGYFQRSQQVQTGLRFALARDEDGWRGGGIVVQALPESQPLLIDTEEDGWRRAMILLGTVRDEELLGPEIDVDTVLHRLFHEEEVRVYPAMPLSHGCRCSEERFETALRQFSAQDLEDMRMEDGAILATCQFCNRSYRFSAERVDDMENMVRH